MMSSIIHVYLYMNYLTNYTLCFISFCLSLPSVVGPEILKGPQAQSVTGFESVIVLSCNVSGFPIPSIIWLHNNTIVAGEVLRVNITTMDYDESNDDPTKFGQAFSTLTISSPNVNDSGDYACQASISNNTFYPPVTSNSVIILVQSEC